MRGEHWKNRKATRMAFYKKFSDIHELLKQYGCKPTYDFEKEYQEPPSVGGGYNFYKPESEMHNDIHEKEWDEVVNAVLDVVIPTKWKEAPEQQIRFDIEYSDKSKLYSLYISLPTDSRSKSLSKKNCQSQDKIVAEINKWLKAAKCKAIKNSKPKETRMVGQQMNIFELVN